ncbi:Holliday junction resolvase RecU [Tepidibacillus marianensis]|uniref:Holliday junction resolvase RecU n=1 Tax=Tepidibacillus marianensis TaxID=3131995 RepID=UPI0030D2A115
MRLIFERLFDDYAQKYYDQVVWDYESEGKGMSHANRGMAFEQLIDYTNRMYEQKGIAVINKRPTPVKILGRTAGKVVGFLESPSTVDFDGTYKGKSIVFEAKSTRELNRFDLKNIHDHQVEYLDKCHRHGAISFLLVEFAKHRTVYLLPYETLRHYWQLKQKAVAEHRVFLLMNLMCFLMK